MYFYDAEFSFKIIFKNIPIQNIITRIVNILQINDKYQIQTRCIT